MKNYLLHCISIILAIAFISCGNEKKAKESKVKPTTLENKNKPPSSYSDTINIKVRSAVFYYPDSLQLEKIKEVTGKNVYESSMHEYFYQLKYAHKVLKEHWSDIKIIEAKNVRYLQFVKTDHTTDYIDLNTKNDAYGLFVFDPAKTPTQLELTNAESEIGFYFSTIKSLKRNK